MEVLLHALTSPLVGGELSDTRPDNSTPGERAPGIQWIGGWVSPRDGLNAVHKKILSFPFTDLISITFRRTDPWNNSNNLKSRALELLRKRQVDGGKHWDVYISNLFNDAVLTAQIVLRRMCNGRTITNDEWRSMREEATVACVPQGTIIVFSWRDQGKLVTRREIRTGDLANVKLN
jgi:hypothetical protein